jgi:hypothetical protein
MKPGRRYCVAGCTAILLAATVPARAGTLECPADSVMVGNTCIDTYEASVGQIPHSNTSKRVCTQGKYQCKALVRAADAGNAYLDAGAGVHRRVCGVRALWTT